MGIYIERGCNDLLEEGLGTMYIEWECKHSLEEGRGTGYKTSG